MNRMHLLLVTAALMAASHAALAGDAPATGPQLLKLRCLICHDLSTTCEALGKRDAAAWKANISTMASYGASVSSEETDVMSEYLAKLAPGSAPVCAP